MSTRCRACEGSTTYCAKHMVKGSAVPADLERHQRLWDEINDASRYLNPWEAEFHESVGRLLNAARPLTPAQAEMLERIHGWVV